MAGPLGIIISVFQQAWQAIVLFIVMVAVIAMMVQILKTIGASAIGARMWVQESLASIVALVLLVLVAFLGIPPIIRAVSASVPHTMGCGPIMELATVASSLLTAIAALRMIVQVARVILGAAVGGAAQVSDALSEVVSGMFGILVVGIVIPLTAALLGAC
jgi:hypothetical protein